MFILNRKGNGLSKTAVENAATNVNGASVEGKFVRFKDKKIYCP